MEGRVQLNISCSPKEYAFWKEQAYQEGESLAAWVRGRLGSPKGLLEPAQPKPTRRADGGGQWRPKPKAKTVAGKPATPPTTINPFARVKTVTHF